MLGLLSAAGLGAQEPRPGAELSPFAGLLAFDQDFRVPDGVALRGLKDAALIGGRFGYTLGRRLALEGAIGVSSQSLDPSARTTPDVLDVTYVSYTAEALVHLAAGSVIPFVAGGFGGLSFDVEADDPESFEESSSGLLATIGGGLKLPLSSSFLVRVDARDIIVRQGARGVESLFGGDGEMRHNISLAAGLALRFGGPGDVDGDGIFDDRDACQDTAEGVPVDERGCVPEIPEGPPPIRTDQDGDGVSDGLDRCPNTPPGGVVDLDGCSVEEPGTSTS